MSRYPDQQQAVAPEDWTVEPVFDSADYLDKDAPRYLPDDGGDGPTPVREAVEVVVQESLRDAAASRERWKRWELSHPDLKSHLRDMAPGKMGTEIHHGGVVHTISMGRGDRPYSHRVGGKSIGRYPTADAAMASVRNYTSGGSAVGQSEHAATTHEVAVRAGKLNVGQKMTVHSDPGGVKIERTAAGFATHHGGTRLPHKTAEGAASHALALAQRSYRRTNRRTQEAAMETVESAVLEVLEARDSSAADSHRNVKCPECDTVQSATHTKCSKCGHDLSAARKAKFAKGAVQEAKDSLAKASTPEPFSSSRTSNWVARVGGLPAYIQHIAHDLVEKRGKSESNAIQMAIGIVKNWASGKGKVDANTRAAAAKAVAEWEAKKAASHAKSAAKAVAEAMAADELDELAQLPEVLEAVEWYADGEGEAARLAILEASVDKTEQRDGDLPRVKCPKCNTKMKPTAGKKCTNCGHDVAGVVNMVTKMRSSKVSEADVLTDRLRDAVGESLE